MLPEKPWYQSPLYIGIVVMAISSALMHFGVTGAEAEITGFVTGLLAALGFGWAIFKKIQQVRNKVPLIALLLLPALGLVGCAPTPGSHGSLGAQVDAAVEKNLPYTEAQVTLLGVTVLELAVSGQDRVDKALIVDRVGVLVAAVDGSYSPAQLSAALGDALPDKPWWNVLRVQLVALYAQIPPSVTQHVRAQAAAAMGRGLQAAAAPYLVSRSPEKGILALARPGAARPSFRPPIAELRGEVVRIYPTILTHQWTCVR